MLTDRLYETALAQKAAEVAARDHFGYGPDVRIVATDGPDTLHRVTNGVRDEADALAWGITVDVPDKGTVNLTVIHDERGWTCLHTQPMVKHA